MSSKVFSKRKISLGIAKDVPGTIIVQSLAESRHRLTFCFCKVNESSCGEDRSKLKSCKAFPGSASQVSYEASVCSIDPSVLIDRQRQSVTTKGRPRLTAETGWWCVWGGSMIKQAVTLNEIWFHVRCAYRGLKQELSRLYAKETFSQAFFTWIQRTEKSRDSTSYTRL